AAGETGFGFVDEDSGKIGGIDAAGDLVFENLVLGPEFGFEIGIGNSLDGNSAFGRHRGGDSGGVSRHHVHRFHSEGGVGDVRGGKGDRDEEILDFADFGSEAAVGDFVRKNAVISAEISLRRDAFFGESPADVMAVKKVGAHGNGVGLFDVFLQVVLGHHVFADHAAGDADVELVRPVVVVGEFVGGETPLAHFGAEVF